MQELLKCYLEKLFLIIELGFRRPGLTGLWCVDGFSDPWAAENEWLSDTLIGILLRILAKCGKELNARR